MAAKKGYYTPTQWRIAAMLSWFERLQEAITAYRFKVAFAKAQIEVEEIRKKRAKELEAKGVYKVTY